jgi:polysaccharide pyruvyl transferase WcaK-like protein
VRKISYAPSANETDSFGVYKEELTVLLKRFHSLSVRDAHTLNLLKVECGLSVCKVLDPTFLVEFDAIVEEPAITYPYLLVYLNGIVDEDTVALVHQISREKNLRIVAIDGFPRANVRRNFAVQPEEWLGLFMTADYVVTNTFHGTVFSIKYEKPFTVILSDHKRAKVYDLLVDLGLTDTTDVTEALDRDIDYEKVNTLLEDRVKTSWRYLESSLNA